jgi:hypothetical protein
MISGGQTGADRAAWRAARAFRVASGGSMPKGFLAEDGPHPEFAQRYGATELATDRELARIEQNVHDSDATVWFGDTTTPDAHATVAACQRLRRPCMPIHPDAEFEPSQVATWITANRIKTLNVAGNRERAEPGISDRVERFLGQVLEQLGHRQA